MKTIRQERKEGADDWTDVPDETSPWRMRPGYEYRIMIEPAAPKWPQTTMGREAMLTLSDDHECSIGDVIDIANAALAHACETGQVVPADKVREIEAKARDEGVKEGERREWARNNSPGLFNRAGPHNQVGYQGIGPVDYKKGAS